MRLNPRPLLVWAALSGAMAIAAGAFGAHGAVAPASDWLKTGAYYQLTHALAALLLLIGIPGTRMSGPAALLLGGATLFAATLYALALGAPRATGMITPIGGAALILGWLWCAWCFARAGTAPGKDQPDGRS